jgi:DNA-binding NarL/FixJ family response regulator
MAQCITCGTELHPERAQKYNYCMAPDCQEKNAKGLTMVAIGMNKAADELMILDEHTAEDLASGKYRDQRRGSFGTSTPDAEVPAAPRAARSSGRTAASARPRPHRPSPSPAPARRPWTARQERLARIYNEQGLRPDEIADKLGVSVYTATQIILAARSHARA